MMPEGRLIWVRLPRACAGLIVHSGVGLPGIPRIKKLPMYSGCVRREPDDARPEPRGGRAPPIRSRTTQAPGATRMASRGKRTPDTLGDERVAARQLRAAGATLVPLDPP